MSVMIFAGQGPVRIGDYDPATKSLANQLQVGCVASVLKLSPSRETAEIKETCSGARGTKYDYEKSKTVGFELELVEFEREMLAQALYGDLVQVAGGSVTGEVMPTMVAGGIYSTRHPKISALVVKDSAGSPATLVAGTHYTLDSADYGRIVVNSLGSFVQPFNVDYTYAARENIKPFVKTGVVRGIIFDGVSTIDGSKARIFLPRISFDMTSEFSLISEDPTPLKMTGKLLVADVASNDPVLGPYGAFQLL